MALDREALHVSRRQLLIGGGIGVGLLVAWAALPRNYRVNLRAAPGETVVNAFLKLGTDGRVIVAVPQAELGQGVYTSLPQILADELGADWRTVSVEPSPISPFYANRLLAGSMAEDDMPALLRGIGGWAARKYATRTSLMVTGGSTSIRAFEPSMREAGAAARILLCKAAARRWQMDWEELDTRDGFVIAGDKSIAFAELADHAMREELPGNVGLREGGSDRLVGESLPRLDLPSKVDGSAQFAGDIRLPGLVYASVRRGPFGDSRLVGCHEAEARRFPGVVAIVQEPQWVGAVAANWWAANRAIEILRPRFTNGAADLDSGNVERRLAAALAGKGHRFMEAGEPEEALSSGAVQRASYSAWVAPNAPLETLTATARFSDNGLEIWAPVQAPEFARQAAARAAAIGEDRVTLYRTMIGGGYGRKLETQAIEQAVVMAKRVGRPVQLVWSRIEETMQDSFRPPARAELAATLNDKGLITAWHARIAAPSTLSMVEERLRSGQAGAEAESEAAAVAGANPPYSIPAVAVDHHPATVGVPTGIWRSQAHSYTAFFTESFIDELARQARIEPLSFRMQMLGSNPRLARTLTTAAALGGWDGGSPGSMKGLAAHSAFGSHAALMVEVEMTADQHVVVRRAVCAIDCGRTINPDIVRQQVEGGILTGIAGATGRRIEFSRGLPGARSFGDLGLPTLASSPEVIVELLPSEEEPGGVTELAVPPVAPAIANAVFALTGRRVRSLPIGPGGRA